MQQLLSEVIAVIQEKIIIYLHMYLQQREMAIDALRGLLLQFIWDVGHEK